MPFHSAIKCVVTRIAHPLRRFVAQDFLQARAPAGIETQARLIEEQNGRVRQKEQREAEPLAHAAGKRAGALVRRIGEADLVEQRSAARGVDAAQSRVEFQDVEAAEPRMKLRVLREVGERALRRDDAAVAMSWPQIDALPASARARPARIFIVVLLPAPLEPTSKVSSPGCDARATGRGAPTFRP